MRTPFVQPASSYHGISESELIRLTIAEMLFTTHVDPSCIDTLLIASSWPIGGTVLEEAASTCRLLGCDGYLKVIPLDARISSDLAALFIAAAKIRSHESRAALVVGAGLGDVLTAVSAFRDEGFPSREIARQYPSRSRERTEYVEQSRAKYDAAMKRGHDACIRPVILPPYYEQPVTEDERPVDQPGTTPEVQEKELMPPIRAGLGAVLLAGTECPGLGAEAVTRRLGGFVQIGIPPSLRGAGAAVALECLLRQEEIQHGNIELLELSEISPAQALSTVKRMRETGSGGAGLEESERDCMRINPAGGALAYGFAPCASGIRMLASLLRSMDETGARSGALAFEDPAGEAFAFLVGEELSAA
jgi:acetyl-CoA acetyltransferase